MTNKNLHAIDLRVDTSPLQKNYYQRYIVLTEINLLRKKHSTQVYLP